MAVGLLLLWLSDSTPRAFTNFAADRLSTTACPLRKIYVCLPLYLQ